MLLRGREHRADRSSGPPSSLGWTWNTWGDCDNILITDYSGIPTSNFGKTFEAHLAAVSP
jgi:hypothetical protein